MPTEAQPSNGSSPSSTNGGRSRSGASSRRGSCLNCRRKRMKCSRIKPSCRECDRSRDHGPCIYEGTPVRLTTALTNKVKALEEQISLLESKKSTRHRKTSPQTEIPYSPSSAASHTANLPPPDWINGEPPEDMRRYLIGVFVRYRYPAIFQVHLPRFFAALELPPNDPDALHPCLLNSIYLTACHWSRPTHGAYERIFLRKTRLELDQSLSMANKLWHFILASTFLARWYLVNGRFVEAHHNTSAISHFAISCRLDQISSPWLADAPISILGPPRDSIELGERVCMFWAVFLLDRAVSLSSGLPGSFDEDKITTIWPLSISKFQNNSATLVPYASSCTMFSPHDIHSLNASDDDPFTLVIKALCLTERAARFASRLRNQLEAVRADEKLSNTETGDGETLGEFMERKLCDDARPELNTLDAGIRRFIGSVPHPTAPNVSETHIDADTPSKYIITSRSGLESTPTTRGGIINTTVVSTLTISNGGIIELHSAHAEYDSESYAKVLAASRVVAELAHSSKDIDVAFHPVTCGLVWTVACDALIRDARRLMGEPILDLNTQREIVARRGEIGWLLESLERMAGFDSLYEAPYKRLKGLNMDWNTSL